MSLTAEVKQKNNQLLLQCTALQQQLDVRINTPEFSSFLVTFAIAPFLVGVVTGLSHAPKGTLAHQLYRIAFPGLRLWSLF
jgi:hypothetical protein